MSTNKLISVCTLLLATSASAGLYVGSGSTEARYTFKAQVRTTSRYRMTEEHALKAAEAQVQHLFGPWSLTPIKAVPKENHTLHIEQIERTGPGNYLVTYTYDGTIVLGNFNGSSTGMQGKYPAFLPVNPAKIYRSAMQGTRNPCTDEHYQTEGDFWYFWAPAPLNQHCKLVEGTDYIVVEGEYQRIPNSRTTYPEYHRLADPSTGAITMSLFFGLDDPDENTADPDTSGDVNAANFLSVRRELLAMGFTRHKLDPGELRDLIGADPATLGGDFSVERLEKTAPRAKLQILLFFGATGIEEKSRPFHLLYQRALAKDAVLLYNGHSGLGGHLDLADIAEMEAIQMVLPQDRYQIFYFNSCTSYTYYNLKYFEQKRSASDPRGTRNLDIFANGLSTYFNVMHETDTVLIKAIHDWATQGQWTSYQEMAALIDSDNLFGINGDEDNPTEPVAEAVANP